MLVAAWRLALVACVVVVSAANAAEPMPRTTVIGSVYQVDAAFDRVIADNIAKARKLLQKERDNRKLIGYVSVPISARGGGHEPTNLAISAHTKRQLEARYGRFYALDPGELQLPKVDGREAGGGEYLYMWTEILAGADGTARDFDMAYFVGPSDVEAFFRHWERQQVPRVNWTLVDLIVQYLDRGPVEQTIRDDPRRRREFLCYYALRASVAYSKGAHDEWNLFVRINKKRSVGNQVPMYYDGRAVTPVEMETEILPGYELIRGR